MNENNTIQPKFNWDKAKKMTVIYDSGWVREPDDRYDRKQRKYVTITVRGAMVYTVAVMAVAALVTVLLLDIISR